MDYAVEAAYRIFWAAECFIKLLNQDRTSSLRLHQVV